VQRSRWRRHAKPSPHLSETIFRKADRPVPAATAGGLRGVKDFSPTAAVTCNSLGIGGDPAREHMVKGHVARTAREPDQ